MVSLREQWVAGRTTMGGWLSVPSPVSAEAAARVGFDYVCIDTQHGAVGYETAIGMLQALALGNGAPVVRVPWNEPGTIGKMLDAGAEGIIVPMVNSAAEAEAVVRACRYAPGGSRSWGPALAGMRRDDYHGWATANIAVIPMIETVEALDHLDEILATPGVDAVYVGPADLSVSLGLSPGNHDEHPEFREALGAIVAACRKAGVVAGIHASGALAARRLEQGFHMVTVASDLHAIRSGMAGELALARGGPSSSDGGSSY